VAVQRPIPGTVTSSNENPGKTPLFSNDKFSKWYLTIGCGLGSDQCKKLVSLKALTLASTRWIYTLHYGTAVICPSWIHISEDLKWIYHDAIKEWRASAVSSNANCRVGIGENFFLLRPNIKISHLNRFKCKQIEVATYKRIIQVNSKLWVIVGNKQMMPIDIQFNIKRFTFRKIWWRIAECQLVVWGTTIHFYSSVYTSEWEQSCSLSCEMKMLEECKLQTNNFTLLWTTVISSKEGW
jgi:hypothetical protein